MKTSEKMLNVKLPVSLHKEIKMQSVRLEMSLKDLVAKALQDFIKSVKEEDDYLIAEPLDEDDLKAMELGKDDIVNGDYEPLDKVYKELENEDRDN